MSISGVSLLHLKTLFVYFKVKEVGNVWGSRRVWRGQGGCSCMGEKDGVPGSVEFVRNKERLARAA